jgi:hypothetical protein
MYTAQIITPVAIAVITAEMAATPSTGNNSFA